MPKVHRLKAGKDYPAQNIKKGSTYYKWTLFHRPVQRSATPPKPWQLTGSDFLQRQYILADQIENLTTEELTEDLRDELVATAREMGEECQEKFDNMPEGLQQGSTGELLEERANACEEWASDMEAVEIPEKDDDDSEDEHGEKMNSALDELLGCEYSG